MFAIKFAPKNHSKIHILENITYISESLF